MVWVVVTEVVEGLAPWTEPLLGVATGSPPLVVGLTEAMGVALGLPEVTGGGEGVLSLVKNPAGVGVGELGGKRRDMREEAPRKPA